MRIGERSIIDYEFVDHVADCFVLAIVELRPWGAKGELIPDLQAKIESYLAFASDGRLIAQCPVARGKRIAFRLVYSEPPTQLEANFVASIRREYLDAAGIIWQQELNDPSGV